LRGLIWVQEIVMNHFLSALAAVLLCAAPASADTASRWSEDGPSAIRLLSGRPAEADGSLLVGVEIRLQPGWKTYWREPGESGVPPQLDWSGSDNVKTAEILFPAPRRFQEGDSWTVGYDQTVVLPVRVTPQDPGRPVKLNLTMDYAVCEKLCVPAHGTAILVRGPEEAADRFTAAGIESALKKVPQTGAASADGAPAVSFRKQGQGILVSVAGTGEVDLFAHGSDAWSPPVPKPRGRDAEGRSLFFVKTLKAPAGSRLSLVAVAGASAVEIPLDAAAVKP
jgi:DsbC/DsbD-like thiol-disulfide interchange protein